MKFHSNEKICSNIEILLDFLGIPDYRVIDDRVFMPCPIHGGDNPRGCVIFLSGEKSCGNWKCFTHHCDLEGNTIEDFIKHFNKKIPKNLFKDCKVEKKITRKERKEDKILCSKKEWVKFFKIPSFYFLNRGFSKEILEKYGVGYCNNPKSSMYLRSVVPVLDEQGENIIGAVGRSIFEECLKCKCHHGDKYPCPEEEWKRAIYCKWKNSKFNADQNLYNLWKAKDHFKDTAIIVESQGYVWKLEECGIHNVVGTFGCYLKPRQANLLEKYNVNNLIILYDLDEAGQNGIQQAKEKYNFNIIVPKYNKDLELMNKKEIVEILNNLP